MTANRKPHCRACDNTGTQPAIIGGMRPCSRCDFEGFRRWYAAQPGGAPTPVPPATDGGDAA